MKTNYEGFRGWINYIRDYKDNKDNDLISANEMIKANNIITKQNREIDRLKFLTKEKDNLLEKKENRINLLNEKLSSVIKENKDNREQAEIYKAKLEIYIKKLQDKEQARRKNASAIGGYNKKINELKLELEKAKHKINFLENSKHAPSKEEIIAYETRMKEVEKRQKNGTI